MKKAVISLTVFLLAFLTGSVWFLMPKKISVVADATALKNTPVRAQPEPKTEKKNPEITSYPTAKNYAGAEMLEDDYWEKEFKYKFELLEPGGYHGDEVTAKSGEKRLGLFGNDTDFYLAPATLEIQHVHDEIVDGADKKIKTGKKVSVKNQKTPIFLIKSAGKLRAGKVTTLFKGALLREESEDTSTELKSEFAYNYEIGGAKYVLRVEKVFNRKQETVYALILESGEKKQILHVSNDDYLGTLFWVGDLDGDAKPDFYLAPWIRENTSESSLFLSSEAGKNALVKKVASLMTSGC